MSNVQQIISAAKRHLNKKDVELIKKAYNFAERVHSGQKRLSGEPYFIHAVETAKILASIDMDAQTIATGLLHDTIEDLRTTEEEVGKEFGEDILFLIKGVTKLGTLKYRGHERHVESLRKFFVAMANDIRVVIIKLADRLHNLRTLEYVREDKRKRIALESIEVYAQLASRLGIRKLKGEIEDTAFPYVYPKESAQVDEIIKEKKLSYQKSLSEIQKILALELKKNKVKVAKFDSRMKHKYSLWKKLTKKEMDIEKIYDIVALRVVVETVEECYRVLGIIHSLWKPLPGRIKDYIAVPKPNGYRSIHTTIITENGIAEIQVRTEQMDIEANYGVAAHFAYKDQDDKKPLDNKEKFKWIEELNNLHYAPGDPKNFLEHLKMDFFSRRIFIFTPKGDVIDLPEDSCPIDFAFSVHSDVGYHITGSRVNGKISPIFSKLHNGDMVEIITKKDAKPSVKWLESVKTSIAKKHIRSYLEKNTLLSKLKSFGKS